MGKNSCKRYRVAYCVVKENISARIWRSKQRMNKIFYCRWIQSFYCGQIFYHLQVSRPLRKWPPMPAKTKIVYSASPFFCQRTTCLVRNRIIHAKIIYITTKIKKIFWCIPSCNFWQSKIKLASQNFWQSKGKLFPTYLKFLHHEIENKDIFRIT